MQPADLISTVEVRERAGDAEHPVIAPRRQTHAFGGLAQQLQALCIRLRNVFQHRGRSFGVGPDIRESNRGIVPPERRVPRQHGPRLRPTLPRRAAE